jgi:hypothetical protein
MDATQAILHSAVDAPGRTSLYGFFSSSTNLESHFWIYNDGTIEQYIDTSRTADANYHANVRAISIETEDDGDPNRRPWTTAQVASIKRLLDWICATHPKVARRQCPAWDQPGIGWHSMWGAPSHWTPARGKTCPGTIRIPQARNIIAAIAAPKPAPTPAPVARKEYDDMHTPAMIVKANEKPEWWLTDLITKQHIKHPKHADWLRFFGVGKWDDANKRPVVIELTTLNSIPTRA